MKRAREGDGFAHDVQEFKNDREGANCCAADSKRPRISSTDVGGSVAPYNSETGVLEVQAIELSIAQRFTYRLYASPTQKQRGVYPREQARIACE